MNTVPKGSQPLSWLWIVHAVLPPLIPVAVLGSFVLQPDILNKIKQDRVEEAAEHIELRGLRRHTEDAAEDIELRELGRDIDANLNSDASQSTSTVTEFRVTGDSTLEEMPLVIKSESADRHRKRP